MITHLTYNSVVTQNSSKGAWIRKEFPGFKEDYLVIHSLIRKYSPKRFMEIGTSTGNGTNVICKAMGIHRFWRNQKVVYSIDVPRGTDPSIIYPEHEDGHPVKAGKDCVFPYHQIFGNSKSFDFSPYYPLDAWFIDGKHDYEYCLADSKSAFLSDPRLIIWHDFQIDGVREAVEEIVNLNQTNYDGFCVEGTRIAFATKKNI